MVKVFQRMVVAVGLTGVVLLTGCGPGVDGRYPVRGTVTYNGELVAGGSILFIPVDAGGSGAIKVGGMITDGGYDIPAGHGPRPGAYRVEISWHRPTGRKLMVDDPPTPVDERVNVIPDRYNKNTTLAVEIKPERGVFDFRIDGPPADPKKR